MSSGASIKLSIYQLYVFIFLKTPSKPNKKAAPADFGQVRTALKSKTAI